MNKSVLAALLSVFIAPVFATSGGGDKPMPPTETNKEHSKLMEQLIGVKIPVPQFEFDIEAQNSDLGKLSKALLGQLYTHIQSIDYQSDDKAIVKARVANLSCEMEYITMKFAGDSDPTWKLNNLSCLEI